MSKMDSEKHTQTGMMSSAVGPSTPPIVSDDTTGKQLPRGVAEIEQVVSNGDIVSLVSLYVCCYLLMLCVDFESQTTRPLQPYALSAFRAHALAPATTIVANLVGGVGKLPIAKLSDIWGRDIAIVFSALLNITGLVIAAASRNVVQYSVAQVFQTLGNESIGVLLNVLVTDTTSPKRRSLMYAALASPRIITTFIGPTVAEKFLKFSTWRWGFGAFALLVSIFALPVVLIIRIHVIRAKRTTWSPRRTRDDETQARFRERTWAEWDLPGLLLICAGFTLILLPLAIAPQQKKRWRSTDVIVMLVFGALCLVSFILWEVFSAWTTLVPAYILKDRTVQGGCLTFLAQWSGLRCYEAYFTSYIQVAFGQSVKNAGYIKNIYSLGSAVFSFPVALFISQYWHCKWVALSMLPIKVLGAGLMIYFRHPSLQVGYMVMCQILISLAEGAILMTTETTIMARLEHGDVATVWAIMTLFQSVGASIGGAIAGEIWTTDFLQILQKTLPDSDRRKAKNIYGSIKEQLAFPWGSPTRQAINYAYAATHEKIFIASTTIFAVSVLFLLMWKDVPLHKRAILRD